MQYLHAIIEIISHVGVNMHFTVGRDDLKYILGIGLLGALFLGGSYELMKYSVDHFVKSDAENTAHRWGDFFSKNLEDIDQIASGQTPSEESKKLIRQTMDFGEVFRLKIYDKLGKAQLVAGKTVNSGAAQEYLYAHNWKAHEAVSRGAIYTEVIEGTPPHRPPLYVETFLPVMVDGDLKAILEVFIDQTDKRETFRTDFILAEISLVLLITMFFVGTGAYYFRTQQKKKAEKHIAYLAHYDPMTGALNKSSFYNILNNKLKNLAKNNARIAIYIIDIDHFREINDEHGFNFANEVLFEVTNRLRSLAGTNNFVCRAGGDEFIILKTNVSGIEQATIFAENINKSTSMPIRLGDHSITSSTSIGIAIAPDDGTKAEALINNADLALDFAKQNGRNTHRRFNPQMEMELSERRKIENVIRKAVAEKKFELLFQPILITESETLTGFETLLRLPQVEGQTIPPDVFIPIAENTGLISQIGDWVIHQACAVAANWPENLKVAVNLSPLQFRNSDIVKIVISALERSGLAAHRLELEITEGLLLEDTENILEQLQALKAVGATIAMDDFGTGYSSLSYLWKFPFDNLKIDKSFMLNLDSKDEDAYKVIKTIVDLGHSLNMKVTIEGVETPFHVEYLKDLNCDWVQGFHYGRPMKAQDIAEEILRHYKNTLPVRYESNGQERQSTRKITN